MKIILASDTRTGSTVVYQTLIDIYGVDNVLKLHLDNIYDKLEIVDNKLIVNNITKHYSIDSSIDASNFEGAKVVFTTRDKYEQILSAIRTKYSLKSTNDINVDLVDKHFTNVIDHRIKNHKEFGFKPMLGLHKHFEYFLDWFDKINSNNLDNVLLLPYHLFNNNFNYLFNQIENFFGDFIDIKKKNEIISNRSRSKNLEISNTMNNFNTFDSKTNIHGLHVSKDDNYGIQNTDFYKRVKENIDLKMKDVEYRIKFRKYQEFNNVKYSNKKILVFGDSHTDVFRYVSIKQSEYLFDVILVGGATAQGSVNPMSKTNALSIFRDSISKMDLSSYDKVLVMLGEVDCGFLIWYRSNKYKISLDEQLNTSTKNLSEFLKNDVSKNFNPNNIVICGAILPTIKDGVEFGDIANLRREVEVSQKDKTALTIKYNNILKSICNQNNYVYMDINNYIVGVNGLIDDKYINEIPTEQHLPNEKVWKFWYDEILKIKNYEAIE